MVKFEDKVILDLEFMKSHGKDSNEGPVNILRSISKMVTTSPLSYILSNY